MGEMGEKAKADYHAEACKGANTTTYGEPHEVLTCQPLF